MHFSQGWVQFGYRFSNDFAPVRPDPRHSGHRLAQPTNVELHPVGRARRLVRAHQRVGCLLGSHTGLVSSSEASLAAPVTAPRESASWYRLTVSARALIAALIVFVPAFAAVHAHAHARRQLLGHGGVPGARPGAGHRPSDRLSDLHAPLVGRLRWCSSRSVTPRSAPTCSQRSWSPARCAITGATVAYLTERLRRRNWRGDCLRGLVACVDDRPARRSARVPLVPRSRSCCCCSLCGPTDTRLALPPRTACSSAPPRCSACRCEPRA